MEGIGTVVESMMRILEAARNASPMAGQRGGDPFWLDSARQLLRYAIPVLYAANGSLSVSDIIRFISTSPTQPKDVTDAGWQKCSFMYQVMEAAIRSPKVPMSRSALEDNISYWAEQYPAIPEKTRGNIVITVATVLDRFKHGRLQRAFCGRTTLVPEMSIHGSIILMAMPTSIWNEDGIIAQQLFKFLWQRAVLGRNNLAEKHRERPVFLWSDEAQETVNSHDADFVSMARGSKCCVTYLTQSLPNYYAKMGGDTPRDAAHSLVGKFNTHIYHSNACPETNEFASRMIGKVVKRRGNYNSGTSQSLNYGMSAGSSENDGYSSHHGFSSGSSGGQGGRSSSFNSGSGYTNGTGSNWGENRGRGTSENVSRGYSESMEYAIEPGDFARVLRTGGRENGNEVTGVWFRAGTPFKQSGTNFLLGRFKQ
jgi:hypothetical protein